ncbi:hypothetical protein AACH06_11950 [Ideonella sp. DXS29W]|uniref:ApeI dehydratase-like domain-containing protein n=1 Tax=Ideonella lacteola TaxID=2984193 RepID=A0ABU9BP36_9BURK
MTSAPRSLQVERRLSCRHPSLAGHFPGKPVFPGVVLLAEVMEVALDDPPSAVRLGDTPRVEAVKFMSPVLPTDQPDVVIVVVLKEAANGVDFEVHSGERVAVRGQLRCMKP